jgi:DNA-binding NarL/FixJ family response regulator
MPRPRLLLADDHTLVLEAFRAMLEPEYEIVGAVADGRSLVDAALRLKPDLIVLDLYMPLLNGLDAARLILQELPAVKLVVLTMDQDPDLAACAFRMGVSGYLLKNSAGAELKKCLAAVCSGQRYLTRTMARGSISDLLLLSATPASPENLSEREREVLQLLAEGRPMKQVADILEISPRTVQFHKYRVMERFHLKSSAEVVQFAIHNKLIAA